MIGRRLDRFHGLGLRFIELSEDLIKLIGRFPAEYWDLGDIGASRERLEPCQLDLNPPFDEPVVKGLSAAWGSWSCLVAVRVLFITVPRYV